MQIQMKSRLLFIRTVLLSFSAVICLNSMSQEPVTPNASPEVKALLKYIQGLSGKYILSGQHNFPASGERNTLFAADYIGKTPVVWSQDFGFAKEGDKDSYLSRPAIIQEAINQHKKGAIIALCWHAVPPTAEEPITFQPLPGADPAAPLASVQGRLTDKQFHDILTPGTALYKQWARQVDVIASYLKQLQEAKVPVLWRPYHEMNGDWFWWGGRFEGKYTTAALYRQIFDRLVKYHKLNNLIWVWSVDRPSKPGREFVNYYPGTQYLDILAIDIYGNDFNQSYYNGLIALSKGKPVTLGEVGNPPAPEVLEKQPNWVYWVVWSGMVRGTSQADYEKLLKSPHVLFFEDPAYLNSTRDYRISCGFEPVKLNKAADFTGEWRLNDCESNMSLVMGAENAPVKLYLEQKDNSLNIKSVTPSEWSDDETSEQILTLDGRDNQSVSFMNAPRVQNAVWSPEKDTLTINSKIVFKFADKPTEFRSKEVWTLQKRGKKLVIIQTADGFMGRGPTTSKLVYNKL
jgi:mannan endo-1,4-beta-mannosidase